MFGYLVLAIVLGLATWGAVGVLLSIRCDGYGRPERVPRKPVPFGAPRAGSG